MKKSFVLPLALIEIVFFLSLWLIDSYVAFYLTLILVGIAGSILLISLIVELIEPSKVSRTYFILMLISIIVPLVVMALFSLTGGGGVVDWLE